MNGGYRKFVVHWFDELWHMSLVKQRQNIIKLPFSILSPGTKNTWAAQIIVRYQAGDKTNKIRISLFDVATVNA